MLTRKFPKYKSQVSLKVEKQKVTKMTKQGPLKLIHAPSHSSRDSPHDGDIPMAPFESWDNFDQLSVFSVRGVIVRCRDSMSADARGTKFTRNLG